MRGIPLFRTRTICSAGMQVTPIAIVIAVVIIIIAIIIVVVMIPQIIARAIVTVWELAVLV